MTAKTLVTQRSIAAFTVKAALLRVRRGLRDTVRRDVRPWTPSQRLDRAPVLAQTRSALWSAGDEAWHQQGKVQNLRVAARRLHGIELPPGEIFSFWAQVGPPTAERGFAVGRELREGCLIPSVGGGLCQLSNALYQVALRAGFEIVERHAHSARVPGSAAQDGRDATVFWNYVDLRFCSDRAIRLEVELDDESLWVRVRGAGAPATAPNDSPEPILIGALAAAPVDDCASCGEDECARHAPELRGARGATALLLDGVWPEFDAALSAQCSGARAFVPLDGRRFKLPRYAWSSANSGDAVSVPLTAVRRALDSRTGNATGANRQRAQLAAEARLARAYRRRLDASITSAYVQQGLLPELFRSGELGGRAFTVLADRLPIFAVHERLDRLAAAHPQSPTAADFRANAETEDLERQALERAERILTPHLEIAQLFAGKSELLPWAPPRVRLTRRRTANGRPRLLFPAATLARKGAYELRSALAEFDCDLLAFAGEFEGPDFWGDRRPVLVTPADLAHEPLDAVVLPAWVEFQPRTLLAALAAGIPVVATTACGLPPREGLALCAPGDIERLREALAHALESA